MRPSYIMDYSKLSTKQIKEILKKQASENPDKYFATTVLKEQGFSRKQCTKCQTYFWSTQQEQICGDPSCRGKYTFIGNSPCKEPLNYTEVYKRFKEMFNQKGYTPIQRYPTVARWNPTMEYTIASIAAFQPYVVTGQVEPPANPLVIPQFCMRFADIDNVGITGSHHTGFVMIGQHAFTAPDNYTQDKYFQDIHDWLTQGLGISTEEISYHEDGWAGGGNGGCCMEFFVRGVEVGNQVYMTKEITKEAIKDLPIKVLDMGMGQERCTWLSQGTGTIYEAVFPQTLQKMYSKINIKPNKEIMAKFVPHAGKLNLDEADNITQTWQDIAQEVGLDTQELKEAILPQAACYAIAEHARTVLFALADGALPSNTGGGYNLRIITRRALSCIDKYEWNLHLPEICSWHAQELKEQYPELQEKLMQVEEILNVEKIKYDNTKQKTKKILKNMDIATITEEKLIELYDANGITPELIAQEAKEQNKTIKIPEDFYMQVAKRHEKQTQEHQTTTKLNIDTEGIEETRALYFEDYKLTEFSAKVLYSKEQYVILDQTAFYPTSGGQLHDKGTLNGQEVVEVKKQGKHIIHILKENNVEKGQEVQGRIDRQRRMQLAKHHTATHIINAAAKKVLGEHINQAGAKKTQEKAHIDITHYQSITEKQTESIEEQANKIIQRGIPIKLSFMPRTKAEKMYGMQIYQGGAVPGKKLRIVDIIGTDIECCGGTHLTNTEQAEKIKILKTTKISDSVVRIEFVAGKAAQSEEKKDEELITTLKSLLNCEENQIPARTQELFSKWKKVKKLKKKNQPIPQELQTLTATEIFEGDSIKKTAEILKTQPEHIVKTVKRFQTELI